MHSKISDRNLHSSELLYISIGTNDPSKIMSCCWVLCSSQAALMCFEKAKLQPLNTVFLAKVVPCAHIGLKEHMVRALCCTTTFSSKSTELHPRSLPTSTGF